MCKIKKLPVYHNEFKIIFYSDCYGNIYKHTQNLVRSDILLFSFKPIMVPHITKFKKLINWRFLFLKPKMSLKIIRPELLCQDLVFEPYTIIIKKDAVKLFWDEIHPVHTLLRSLNYNISQI